MKIDQLPLIDLLCGRCSRKESSLLLFYELKKTKNGWKNRGKKVGSSTNKVDDISINSFGNDYCYFLRMMTNRK